MRKFYLQPLQCTSVDDNSVIILGGKQFTIYDGYYVEQNIDITGTDSRKDRLKISGRGGPWIPVNRRIFVVCTIR